MPPGGGATPAADPVDNGLGSYYIPLVTPPADVTATGGAVPPASDQDDASGDTSGSQTSSSPIYQISPKLTFGSLNPNNKSKGFGLSLALMKQKQLTYNWQSCSANNAGNRGGSSYTYNSQTSSKSNYGICIGVGYTWDDAARDIDVTLFGEVTIMEDEFSSAGFDVPAFEVGVAIGF